MRIYLVFILIWSGALYASEPRVDSIDYKTPYKYLEIVDSLGDRAGITSQSLQLKGKSDLATIRNVIRWVHQNLGCDSAKAYAWRNYDDVMREKVYGGCADEGIVCGVLLKGAGIPVVWVKTMDVSWIWDYKKRRPFNSWSGHVFLEVYVNGKWMLLDPGAELIFEDYSTEMRILPGYRFAYDKGNDPREMIMSLQWEQWKRQTELYFRNLDENLLPVDVARGKRLTRYCHIIGIDRLSAMEQMVLDSGLAKGMVIGRRYDEWLPQTKGDVLLVETYGGKPVVDLDLLEKYFPGASQGLQHADGIIRVGETTIVFMDFSKPFKKLDITGLE